MDRKGKIYTNQIRIIVARNLLNSIKILIRALQLFCVLPVYLNLVNDCDLNRRKVKFFKLLQFIRAVVLIFACVSPIFYQWQYYDTNLRFLTRILFFTEYIYTSINIVLIFIKCHSYRAEISQIFNHLVNTDLKLNGCGLKVNHGTVKKRIQLLSILILLGLFLILVMEFIYNNNNLEEAFSNSIVFLTTECIQNSALILYGIILYIVQLKLDVMTDHMEYMIQIHNESLNSPYLITEIPSLGIHPQDYWRNIFQILKVEYFGLLNLAKILTDIYGYVLMSTIICTFIDLTIESYTFYIQFDEDYNNEDEMFNSYLIGTAVLWTLLGFSKLFIILVPCNSMQNQVSFFGISNASMNRLLHV